MWNSEAVGFSNPLNIQIMDSYSVIYLSITCLIFPELFLNFLKTLSQTRAKSRVGTMAYDLSSAFPWVIILLTIWQYITRIAIFSASNMDSFTAYHLLSTPTTNAIPPTCVVETALFSSEVEHLGLGSDLSSTFQLWSSCPVVGKTPFLAPQE